ncbi:uncharacterized protein [Chlorocebus sabaeus]|uniref:uncharacterized protein isoform X2 n=1 Tax=Chlorocebus sabaeus TaxID=60711 RepID=UPI003BFA04CA
MGDRIIFRIMSNPDAMVSHKTLEVLISRGVGPKILYFYGALCSAQVSFTLRVLEEEMSAAEKDAPQGGRSHYFQEHDPQKHEKSRCHGFTQDAGVSFLWIRELGISVL